MIRPHYVPLYSGVSMSEKLAALPDDSCRLFYTWLLSHCDAWGRSKAGAGHLTAKVWPLLGKTREDTEHALEECWAAGLIVRYDVDGEAYLAVPDWEEKAGKVGKPERRAPSLVPPPPEPSPRTSPAADGTSPASRARAYPIRSDPSVNRTELENPPTPLRGKRAAPARLSLEQVRQAIAETPSLDTDGFRIAFGLWLRYRDEKRLKPYLPIGLQSCLTRLTRLGPERAIAAMEYTRAQGWQGIREEEPGRIAASQTKLDRSFAAIDRVFDEAQRRLGPGRLEE